MELELAAPTALVQLESSSWLVRKRTHCCVLRMRVREYRILYFAGFNFSALNTSSFHVGLSVVQSRSGSVCVFSWRPRQYPLHKLRLIALVELFCPGLTMRSETV